MGYSYMGIDRGSSVDTTSVTDMTTFENTAMVFIERMNDTKLSFMDSIVVAGIRSAGAAKQALNRMLVQIELEGPELGDRMI
jgi:hypothetical protein